MAGERDRPDVARRRAQWIKYQDRVDPARLVFIDETWTRTNMAPLRGWAPRGSRLIGKVPDGRWRTMTFRAALRHDRITAPWLLEDPIDSESFLRSRSGLWATVSTRSWRGASIVQGSCPIGAYSSMLNCTIGNTFLPLPPWPAM